jgi:hypothetical protein
MTWLLLGHPWLLLGAAGPSPKERGMPGVRASTLLALTRDREERLLAQLLLMLDRRDPCELPLPPPPALLLLLLARHAPPCMQPPSALLLSVVPP